MFFVLMFFFDDVNGNKRLVFLCEIGFQLKSKKKVGQQKHENANKNDKEKFC